MAELRVGTPKGRESNECAGRALCKAQRWQRSRKATVGFPKGRRGCHGNGNVSTVAYTTERRRMGTRSWRGDQKSLISSDKSFRQSAEGESQTTGFKKRQSKIVR